METAECYSMYLASTSQWNRGWLWRWICEDIFWREN